MQLLIKYNGCSDEQFSGLERRFNLELINYPMYDQIFPI